MKIFILFCSLLMVSVLSAQKLQEINPLLHDTSFIAAFGVAPDQTTDEQLRIQTHLFYTEQLLRNIDPATLTSSQKEKRSFILDLLHQYALAGRFPVNRDYPGERRPCFIDDDGSICAVGYLVEQTKGRELAEAINAIHQYDFLLDMKEPAINEWANDYGLTVEECAMIQPTYGYYPTTITTSVDVKPSYGISSGVAIGGNVALSILQLSKWSSSRGLAYAGLITGTGQILLGVLNIKKSTTTRYINGPETTVSYSKQNNLSYVNIGTGTATIVTSALNLFINKKGKEKTNALNLYSYPNYNNSLTVGLTFSKKI